MSLSLVVKENWWQVYDKSKPPGKKIRASMTGDLLLEKLIARELCEGRKTLEEQITETILMPI
jgi:hypothetical protein